MASQADNGRPHTHILMRKRSGAAAAVKEEDQGAAAKREPNAEILRIRNVACLAALRFSAILRSGHNRLVAVV